MKTRKKDLCKLCSVVGIGTIEETSRFEGTINRFKPFRKIPNAKVGGISAYAHFDKKSEILTVPFVYNDEPDLKFNYNTGLVVTGPQNQYKKCDYVFKRYVCDTDIQLRNPGRIGSNISSLGLEVYALFSEYGENAWKVMKNILG